MPENEQQQEENSVFKIVGGGALEGVTVWIGPKGFMPNFLNFR